MKATIQIGSLKIFKISLSFIPFVILFFDSRGQTFVKNGDFDPNLDFWSSSTVSCPVASTNGWVNYSAGLMPGYSTIWEGSAFLKNKIVESQSSPIILKQNVGGLIPAAGNTLQLTLDVILGEANNLNMSNLPAEYLGDNLILEIWLGGVKYATVQTPSGWYSQSGSQFGKCTVNYFEGATSVSYPAGNSMQNIANTFVAGQAPFLHPFRNNYWDISIPWGCDKTDTAFLEIRVIPNTYLNKTIVDSRGQSYSQTCVTNQYNSLDDIAVDNVIITNTNIIDTPALAVTNLTSSVCGQIVFNLLSATSPLSCPLAAPNSLEYRFFEDSDLTIPIENAANFETTQSDQTVYAVLANKVSDANFRIFSNVKRELKISRNDVKSAGIIGGPYELCSNTLPTELSDYLTPIAATGGTLSFFWEKAIGDINGPFTAAAGVNTELSYMPSGLNTANEVITKYYFRRAARSTLNGLTCTLNSAPVEVIVKPCAPTSFNNSIEYIDNPGGLNTVVVPNNLFSATALVGQITNIKISKFPVKATSLTINSTAPGAKVAAPITYCGTPAAVGCVGIPFPSSGVILPTNTSGNPINTAIVIDPLDGSILVEIPYLAIDSRSFVSTEAKASVLFGNAVPLSVKLNKFLVKNIDNQTVRLNWETESESNFKLFEVEAALNNMKFERKSEVFPNESMQYEAELSNLESGIWYFRLKIIDNDGSFEYSPIKSLVLEGANTVTVRGNPATDFIKLDLRLQNGTYHFNLFDNLGKTVLTNSKSINNPISDLQLNQQPLGNGIYFLRITNDTNEHIATKKVILK
jgi:Secretion system C-terminal sorting domain